MDSGEPHFPSFQRGDRLAARGAVWTLVDAERGMDCTALRLAQDHAVRITTLLAPFDRFTPIERCEVPALVGPHDWLRHAAGVVAESSPAGGVQAASRGRMRLLPYQLEPALAVLRYGATRMLVADAVGLGKTVQAGLLVAELARTSAASRVLILVPAGLRDQWSQELSRWFDLESIAADAAWIRATALERPGHVNPWALAGIYVASQDFVKRPEVLRPLEEVAWDLLIVDEAHACSSRSDRRAAADAIARRAARVLLLTATPHAGDPAEFSALCSIGRIDSSEAPIVIFNRSRRDAGGTPGRRSTLLAVRPTLEEQRMHELLEKYTDAVWRESQARGDELARLAAIVLRKRALSSAASLARSVRRRMALLAGRADPVREQLRLPLGDEDPLDDEVSAVVLGAPGLADAPRERRWLAAIAEAAGLASRAESKLRVLRTLLRRMREPAIVFTEYRDTLDRLRAALERDGRVLLLMHGGMAPAERSQVQRRFNSEGSVLLATDAAAEGLNLHGRCRAIVHYELPWSVMRLEQRAGRVDRLGQERRVHEIGLVAASTAERLVLEPLLRRARRARAAGAADGLPAHLTESRVAHLVLGGSEPAPAESVGPGHPAFTAARRLDLFEDAAVEAARLSAAREALSLAAAQPAATPRSAPRIASSIRCRPSRLGPGLVLLYVISLTSAAGQEIHAEPLVLHVSLDGPAAGRISARTLRDLVRTFSSPAHAAVRTHVATAVERALDFALPVHQRVCEALRERRLGAKRVRTSAARQLVQAGLFDRQSSAVSTAGRADAEPEESGPRTSTDVLAVDVSLRAALRVRAE